MLFFPTLLKGHVMMKTKRREKKPINLLEASHQEWLQMSKILYLSEVGAVVNGRILGDPMAIPSLQIQKRLVHLIGILNTTNAFH